MFAHVLPHLAAAGAFAWRNRRDLMWIYDRFRRRGSRGRGNRRVSYMRGYQHGMRIAQHRRNFGYGRGGISRRGRRR